MTKSTYLKIISIVTAAAFAVTLAVLIGDRLSSEAMGVLAGAVCGVGASIPTSLLIIAITRRTQQATPTSQPPRYTPPVVFTVPPVQIQPPTPTPPPATWGGAPLQRHFTVVGEMGEEE